MWSRIKPLLVGLGVASLLQSLGLLYMLLFGMHQPLLGIPFWWLAFGGIFVTYVLAALAAGYESGNYGALYGALLALLCMLPLLLAQMHHMYWLGPLGLVIGAVAGYVGQALAQRQMHSAAAQD